MPPVIKTEALGKKYLLRHEERVQFPTLRDALSDQFKRIVSPGSRRDGRSLQEFWALRDVSLEIKQGDRVGIIGRNGAGKSTLLKILSRITEPSTGEARITGRVASLLEVGTGFHPELTGRENIYLNGAILGMSRQEITRKFDEIVHFAEVAKFLDTPVKRYSSGMYVRLAFAVAAHLDSEVLIVDEVLAVGDAQFQKQCLGKMDEVGMSGRTILFVSHNMTAVEKLCQRAVVVEQGRLGYQGPVAAAIDHYLASFSEGNFGYADLSEHSGRSAGMRRIIQSIGLRLAGDPSGYRDLCKTGDDVVFEISYDPTVERLDYAAIGISTLRGDRICSFGTHLDPGFDGVLSGKGAIVCRIPALYLAGGEYSVLVAVGVRGEGNADCVSDALRFGVEPGDFFNTGQILLPGQGYLALKSQWRTV